MNEANSNSNILIQWNPDSLNGQGIDDLVRNMGITIYRNGEIKKINSGDQ